MSHHPRQMTNGRRPALSVAMPHCGREAGKLRVTS